jgi:hypothetical protein
MTAGGTRQVTSNNSPLLMVMAAPATTPHAPSTITAAHHAATNRARDISFNIACLLFRFWCSPFHPFDEHLWNLVANDHDAQHAVLP